MVAFATVDDYLGLLGKEMTDPQKVQLALMLEDASDHLRDLIGSPVYPRMTSTLTLHHWAGDRYLDIPVRPLVSVDSVKVDGHAREVEVADGALRICGPAKVEVTVTHGYLTAPPTLKSYTIALVVQTLKMMEELGTMASGEVSSIGIDDYQKGFRGNDGAFAVPERVETRLRAQFGTGDVHVVGTR